MRRWGIRIVLSALFSVLALSSVSAWPSVLYGIKASPVQELPLSAEESSGSISEEEIPSTMLLPEPEKGLKTATASLNVQLGDMLNKKDLQELEEPLAVIEAAQQTMVDEYNELMDERDRLAEENEALASDLAKAMNRNDWSMLLVPEAICDIGTREWGIGLSLGVGWNQLLITAGIEKTINDQFFSSADGMRIRFGAGILL